MKQVHSTPSRNMVDLVGWAAFNWVVTGYLLPGPVPNPVSPTFDSHVKCVLHHAFTLQMNLTTPNVEPADRCLSNWGKASQSASNTHQNCLLIFRYYFQFLIRWDSGLLPVPHVALLLPLGMQINRGEHCSVVNPQWGTLLGKYMYTRKAWVQALPVIWDLCSRPVGRGKRSKIMKGLYSGPFPA
jgi:hypothetical protein